MSHFDEFWAERYDTLTAGRPAAVQEKGGDS